MSVPLRTVLVAVAACAVGLAIAFLDSRPSSDDTGVTAAALFTAAAAFAYLDRGEVRRRRRQPTVIR